MTTTPELTRLVRLARRDQPPPAVLEALAHRLRVPFVVAPLLATALPTSALAAVLTKLGVSRSGLLGWSVGGALAIGGAVALAFGTIPSSPLEGPTPLAPVVMATASASSARAIPAPVPVPAPAPEERPLPTETPRPKLGEAPATWDEPQLIERARKALGTDPKRALALTRDYQRRFPGGALTVEREVIALEALARLGQRAEARKRALAFEAAHPTSIHLPRVRALLTRLDAP